MENIIKQYGTPEAMSTHLTALMDEIDGSGKTVDSATDRSDNIVKIEALANYLSWFHPELLDTRFN